ncbi:MbtH family protein [Amycolatopsis magusensis]|uniref:MbtH protein n=1 Tax=Amycolatopsis magusensis TaxID=882444 RepID=A0ABS4Q076_9PSEU|nr:MbtH family protein [Amycolatopsis magusensis]MBP2185072.1 MbtH protein [Amycolatopsis magusensis]MDI5980788.1 MbtH family protein [Amycolatopsis magusensis]
MSNPFADPRGRFVVLLNENGRYSLWPSFVEIPAGWTTVLAESPRQDALDYIHATCVTERNTGTRIA